MQRLEGWEDNLKKYIEQHENRNFKFGANDCVAFVIGAYLVITGIDLQKKLKEENFLLDHKDKKGAYKKVTEYADGTVFGSANKLAKKMKIKKIHGAFAKHGDIVGKYNSKKEEMLGVMSDDGTATYLHKDGIVHLDRTEIKVAWEV